LRKKIVENCRVGADESRLGTVASGKVLRGNNGNLGVVLALNQKDFRVVVSQISALNNLDDEAPKFERLVGRLMVEHKINAADLFVASDEI
jgi:hypothetical protein